MSLTIPIPAKKLTIEQLMQVYSKFCEAYNFELNEYDENYLRNQGIKRLQLGSNIDYRPFMGAKFFVIGNDVHTEFSGYTSDEPQPRESKEFERLISKMSF